MKFCWILLTFIVAATAQDFSVDCNVVSNNKDLVNQCKALQAKIEPASKKMMECSKSCKDLECTTKCSNDFISAIANGKDPQEVQGCLSKCKPTEFSCTNSCFGNLISDKMAKGVDECTSKCKTDATCLEKCTKEKLDSGSLANDKSSSTTKSGSNSTDQKLSNSTEKSGSGTSGKTSFGIVLSCIPSILLAATFGALFPLV